MLPVPVKKMHHRVMYIGLFIFIDIIFVYSFLDDVAVQSLSLYNLLNLFRNMFTFTTISPILILVNELNYINE